MDETGAETREPWLTWLQTGWKYILATLAAFFALALLQGVLIPFISKLLLWAKWSDGLSLILMAVLLLPAYPFFPWLGRLSALLFGAGLLVFAFTNDDCVSMDTYRALEKLRGEILNEWNKCIFRDDETACSNRFALGDLSEIDARISATDICDSEFTDVLR